MNQMKSLAQAETSIGQANGLPNPHYVDPEMFARERQSVLFSNWAGIGFGKDVPQPGDARPVDFLGMPLLMVRDRAGDIAVFQNTCRHRGMILVDQPTRIRGAIRCPYHSWCYGLDGSLRTTPHVGGPGQNTHPDMDVNQLGLITVRSHVWHDVVFVNVNRDAPTFEQTHSDLLRRWAEFDQPKFHGGENSGFTLEVKTNWKLAVENYCESYHLPWIHPGLNSYSRLEDHYNIEGRPNHSGQGSFVYRQLGDEKGSTLPDFAGLSAKWDQAAEYIAVYPNVLLGVQRDHTFAILLQPVDTGLTRERVELYYAQPPEQAPELEDLRVANANRWKEVFEEDIFVVEGMQRGRQGVFFDGGRFSPAMDGPTHNFHRWVAGQVEAGL